MLMVIKSSACGMHADLLELDVVHSSVQPWHQQDYMLPSSLALEPPRNDAECTSLIEGGYANCIQQVHAPLLSLSRAQDERESSRRM